MAEMRISGARMLALLRCGFHDEADGEASLVVDLGNGKYECLHCGATGTATLRLWPDNEPPEAT